jgi:hypothetical protein
MAPRDPFEVKLGVGLFPGPLKPGPLIRMLANHIFHGIKHLLGIELQIVAQVVCALHLNGRINMDGLHAIGFAHTEDGQHRTPAPDSGHGNGWRRGSFVIEKGDFDRLFVPALIQRNQ